MTILRFFQLSKNKCRQVERTGKMTTTTTRGRGRGKTGGRATRIGPPGKNGPCVAKESVKTTRRHSSLSSRKRKKTIPQLNLAAGWIENKKNSNIYSFGIGNNQSFNRAPSPLTVINNDKHIFLKNQITDQLSFSK